MKPILTILLFYLISSTVLAQNKYISPFFSLQNPLFPTNFSTTSDETIITSDTSITENTYDSYNISLGAGTRIGAGFEIKPNENYAFSVSLSYFKSADKEIVASSKMEYDPYTIYNVQIIQTDIYRKKSLDFISAVKLYPIKSLSNAYLKAGVIFSYGYYGLHREVFIRNNLPGYYPTEIYEYEYKISPSFHYGYNTGLGIEFFSDKFITVFIEANAGFMSVKPTKRTCTSVTWNDDDHMPTLSYSEANAIYVDSYTDSDNNNSNQPMKLVSFRQSMSYFGIQTGIKISL